MTSRRSERSGDTGGTGRLLLVDLGRSAPHSFPAVWLRHACGCRGCVDAASGQRLVAPQDAPPNVSISSAEYTEAAIRVVFDPDGHESTFDLAWLAAMTEPVANWRAADAKQLWRGAAVPDSITTGRWPSFFRDPVERRRCLQAVCDAGVLVLRDVPCRAGQVLMVVSTFAYVRETNYGRLFDVRTAKKPSNLAFSDSALAPHTDNPYRDPVPTLQLLHCLSNALEGGLSGFVDGFQAALDLRAEFPADFDCLTRVGVPFAFDDGVTSLSATKPLIELDHRGEVVGVRLNDRSMRPLGGAAAGSVEFYAAHRRFSEIVGRSRMAAQVTLQPGDCVVFDNTRILHSRTAFGGGGARHLQGCYADLDAVASALAVLSRAAA
jgi:gamma-butyrobetaine dioxygenase